MGAFWFPARIRHLPLAVHLLGEFRHHHLARFRVVRTIERKALRERRVAVEHHHRNSARHGVIDGAGDLPGIAGRDEERIVTVVDGLRDALRLHRPILIGRGEPVDGDGDAHLRAEFLGRGIRAGACGEEYGIGGALGDHSDPEGLGAAAAALAAGGEGECCQHETGEPVYLHDDPRKVSLEVPGCAGDDGAKVSQDFPGYAGDDRSAVPAAIRRARSLDPCWSSTTAMINALPMMIHS